MGNNEVICIRERDEAVSGKRMLLADVDEFLFKILRNFYFRSDSNIHIIGYGGFTFRLLGYNVKSRDAWLMFPDKKHCKRVLDYIQNYYFWEPKPMEEGSFLVSTIEKEACGYDILPGHLGVTLLKPLPGKDGNMVFPLGSKFITFEILNLYDSIIMLILSGRSLDMRDALYLVESRTDIDIGKLIARSKETFNFRSNRHIRTRAMSILNEFKGEAINRDLFERNKYVK